MTKTCYRKLSLARFISVSPIKAPTFKLIIIISILSDKMEHFSLLLRYFQQSKLNQILKPVIFGVNTLDEYTAGATSWINADL